MTGIVRAACPDCGEQRQVTIAGTFRRHRRAGVTCPGAGQRPTEPVDLPAPNRGPSGLTGPPPPDEPAAGRSCDGGHCDRPSTGWRLFRGQREWLPVCGIHMDGPPGRTRIHDPQETP